MAVGSASSAPRPAPKRAAKPARPAPKRTVGKSPTRGKAPTSRRRPAAKKATVPRRSANGPAKTPTGGASRAGGPRPPRPAAARAANGPDRQAGATGANPPAALAPAAGMAARGEFNRAPLDPSRAADAYKNLTADKLAGPDDIRLKQLSRTAQTENVKLVRSLQKAVDDAGVEGAAVYGRAKTPQSLFGKLRETPGSTVGDVKDISGARVDVKPTKPGLQDVYKAQDAAQDVLGDSMKLKKDYIKKPNPWGYSGRVHSLVDGGKGLTHELQVGSRDVSSLIDKKLTTLGGDKVTVHDTTFYKGDLYGSRLPPHLEKQYTGLMSKITEANRAGKALEDVPALKAEYDGFMKAAKESLPENLNKAPPPKLSARAKIGNIAGKGMGALGVVGGGFQVADGVGKMQDGKPVEGAGDVGVGAGNIVAGGAMLAGRVALGTTTGGAVAVLDGAKDIYVGVRDGNVEKGVVGGVKGAAGGVMLAGVATANPILIGAGAAAYAGAAIYENRKAIGNAAKKGWGWVKSWF